MFDPEVIESLDELSKVQVRQALATLADCGLIANQMQANLARLALGSANEEPDSLMDKVLEYRRQNTALLIMQELGESFSEDKRDA